MLGQQFAGLQNLPVRRTWPATPLVATREQRAAAERLGAMFLRATASGRSLDREALPIGPGAGSLRPEVRAALGHVHGSDDTRYSRLGRAGYKPPFALYKADYDAVVPLLGVAVRRWAHTTLAAEQEALARLFWRLQRNAVALELSRRATEARVASGGYSPRLEEIRAAYGNPMYRRIWTRYYDRARERYVDLNEPRQPEANLQRVIRARIAPAVRRQGDETLSTLFAHPHGIDILGEYQAGPAKGTRCATWHVTAAQEALVRFRTSLAEGDAADHVWRYPTLVLGGVASLGLHDLPGFPEYAVAIGQLLAARTPAGIAGSAVTAAGVVVFALGLVFTGPVGLVVLAAADLALAGGATALAFIREREQDVLAKAGAFRSDDQRFAEPTTFGDTQLAAAGALLGGLALSQAVKSYQAAKALDLLTKADAASNVAEALARRVLDLPKPTLPTPPDPTATAGRLIGNNGVDGATTVIPNSRATERGKEGVAVAGQLDPTTEPTATLLPARADQSGTLVPDVQRGVDGTSTAADARLTSEDPLGGQTISLSGTAPERTRRPTPDVRRGESGTATTTAEARPSSDDVLGDEAAGTTLDSRGVRSPVVDPPGFESALQKRRVSIQAEIHQVEDDISLTIRSKQDIQRELQQIVRDEGAASIARRADQVARLQRRRNVLVKLYSRERVEEIRLGQKKTRLLQKLRKATKEHFDKITRAAARRRSWIDVGEGSPSRLFRPAGEGDTYTVEHIWPRREMFLEPGFFDLTDAQQIALFAFQPNLIRIPNRANATRGYRAYRTLSRYFVSEFLTGPDALAKLIQFEQDIKTHMLNLINNPSLIK